MAIKLANNVATVPASVSGGVLSLDLLDRHWDIGVPIKQEYDMQLRDWNNQALFGWFTNEKTILLIRRDGTASVVNKETKALYKNFIVEIPKELLQMEVRPGGLATYETRNKDTLLTVGILKDFYLGILSMDSGLYSVVFDTRVNFEYITDVCLNQGVSYPPLSWQGDYFLRRKEYKDPKSEILYKIQGKVISHDADSVVK